MADIRELKMGIGFHKQPALQTALVATDMWSLRQTNKQPGQPEFVTENDANDIGKGTPFPTQLFPVSASGVFPWEYYLSSENAAMLGVYGIGLLTKVAASTGFLYTCKPSVLLTAAPDMPATTIVQAIRPGGSAVFDFALVGMCCEEFTISLKSGPGRDNSTMKSSWVGSGFYANPSGITLPATTVEHPLGSGGTTVLSINGVDYIVNKRFLSLEFNYKNNIRLDTGYFVGSGQQNGFNLRGRMWRANPVATMKCVALFESGSTELATFLAQTEGTAQLTVNGALIGGAVFHSLALTLHRTVLKIPAGGIADDNGLVTINFELELLEHATNGVLTYAATTTQDGIGQ